jgi:hypothetical protein
MCVPSMGIFNLPKSRVLIYMVQVPYGRESPISRGRLCLEPLVSCKVVYREVCTEGSRTAKLGTDEQELDTEA